MLHILSTIKISNTYPKGNREEKDTFEHKTSDNKALETSKPVKEEF